MDMFRLWTIVGLLLYLIGSAESCYGYGTGGPPPPPPPNGTTTNTTGPPAKSKNHTLDIKSVLGGWPPTVNLTKEWTQWVEDYKAKVAQEKAAEASIRGNLTREARNKLKKERGDWPSNWQDLGPGHGGEVPPPWAYTPKNTGLPDFCFQWPERGNCKDNITRWGYNSHGNRCDQFVYSGCGENQNNFKDKLSCEQSCMLPPVSGCDTESQIPADIDYDNPFGL